MESSSVDVDARASPARDETSVVDARVVAATVERACDDAWGAVPLLRPLDVKTIDASRRALDDARARARRVRGERERSVSMPSHGESERASEREESGAMLDEHWEYLRALERQLTNATTTFAEDADGDEGSFAYEAEYEVVREWNGTVLEYRAPEPVLRSKSGLSERAYKKLTGTRQWIRGVSDGARRVWLLSVEAMPTPKAWQSSLDVNAKEIIGVRLYNELSADGRFDAEALADRETYWGSDVRDEGGMSDLDAVTQLDSLEKAEAIWSSKLKEQQTIDSFQTVKGWSHGSRSKALTKRLRNSSTYRKVLYARYPNVELTSLQQMKIQRNDDVALAALAAYSRCLVRVAAALGERALDIFDAHHEALGEENPHRHRPRALGLTDYMYMGTNKLSELTYDLGKFTISSSLGVVGLGPRSCAASPAANHLADRSPATIHYASDTDDSDVEPLSPNA